MSGETSSSSSLANKDERKICANGSCVQTDDIEAKLDSGNIDEAEADLREGLSLNSEEARALLGRLEYQRGNVEAAFRVFEGIDVQAAIQRLQSISTEKISKKPRSNTESGLSGPQQGANLVLEAIYLKTKSLQKLDRINDAAEECKKVLDAVEKIFPHGIPDAFVDTRLQETISRVFELLPQLWDEAGQYDEAVSSYRRALLTQWNLDSNSCARIQNNFAAFLLYSGFEAGPPTTSTHVEGTYVPKNNFEEAILLLMICMRNFSLGKAKWDPTVVEHLTFALSICSQTPILAKQLEEVIPGVIHRVDLWKTLAFCCSEIGQRKTALDLLKKGLHKHEKPDDIISLLLAAKICSEDGLLAAEGIEYAQRALNNCKKRNKHLNGVCLRVLGLCYGKQASVSSSDYERSHLQSEALKSLDEAISLEPENSDLVFELAIQYAMHRNLNNALRLAKQYIDVTGGSMLRGWRLLALILSAQQRFSEAEVVTDAALDETVRWDQGPLLRLKAKLRIAQSRHMDAIETYRHLLALVQAQKKSYGPLHSTHQIEDERVNEYEIWQGLANLYSSLARWKDAEICLGKAREIVECSSETLHTEGTIYQRRGEIEEAMATYVNSLLVESNYVPSKISFGAIMSNRGLPMLPVARTMLSDALRLEPTNRMAWLHLGFVHKLDGRLSDAIDSFQAASMLEESDPIESFNSIL
ncbi:Tetratricopeptide-like helical [Artemisia annua]|uniref:Tetratricopeptide-like helical n=1 Tax=Artemisia annua TaxID=35608 RepID=A0A2U1NQG4_ARTAN|nr:Tetratricopeptide-like helical [Artemisia annua]